MKMALDLSKTQKPQPKTRVGAKNRFGRVRLTLTETSSHFLEHPLYFFWSPPKKPNSFFLETQFGFLHPRIYPIPSNKNDMSEIPFKRNLKEFLIYRFSLIELI